MLGVHPLENQLEDDSLSSDDVQPLQPAWAACTKPRYRVVDRFWMFSLPKIDTAALADVRNGRQHYTIAHQYCITASPYQSRASEIAADTDLTGVFVPRRGGSKSRGI